MYFRLPIPAGQRLHAIIEIIFTGYLSPQLIIPPSHLHYVSHSLSFSVDVGGACIQRFSLGFSVIRPFSRVDAFDVMRGYATELSAAKNRSSALFRGSPRALLLLGSDESIGTVTNT